MRSLLDGKVLGSTPQGRAWALKALHPAASEIDLGGVPSFESLPVVLQNFNSSVQILPPTGVSGPWGFDALFYSHPVFQGCVLRQDANSHVNWQPIINAQLSAGNTSFANAASLATDNLSASCSEYRMAYAGVTGYHDAPATANEGTIAVAQYLEVPQYLSTDSGTGYVALLGEGWPGSSKQFTELQSMPSSYLGNARDGFYAPLKLSREAFNWKQGLDLHAYLDRNFMATLVGGGFTSDVNVRSPGAAGSNVGGFPYGIPSAWFVGSSWSQQRSVHPRCSTDVIHVSVRNLDPASSFTLYLRYGVEMRVRPATPFSALQRAPPVEDVQAMEMYFETSRTLKDAFPADYNDLGKILKDIGAIALEVAPKILPQTAPIIAAGKKLFSFLGSANGESQMAKSLALAKAMTPMSNRSTSKAGSASSVVTSRGPIADEKQRDRSGRKQKLKITRAQRK
jgi:hypothetical protein